ncbi:MAG: hypothetical protein A2Y90_05785 [Chloroflexi bacterium RBG_13_52_12]|nr:MAG: hypothetical protein A2Y90_05785 [Chloroflexi bacterium RBG_13_52_12]
MKVTFCAAALGLLLLVLGSWLDVEALTKIGIFILPLAFLWGGLFKAEQSMALKITLLAIAAILLVSAFASLTFSGMNFGGGLFG